MRAAEAILDAAHNAMRVKSITFEVDHGIDDVLDDLGAGQGAGLGDVADEEDGNVHRLGEVDQFHAAIAKLGDRAGSGRELRLVDHLNRVDDADGGAMLADLVDNALDVGLGEDEEVFRAGSQTRGANGGLAGALFAGDVEDFLI